MLKWIDAGSTPILALIGLIVWKIKTNDLPHILDRLGKIEGSLNEHDKWERDNMGRRRKP